MTGRPPSRRFFGQSAEEEERARPPVLRVGDVLRAEGLPSAYVITGELPPRWGRVRLRGQVQGAGGAVEIWCQPEPGTPLPGPLSRLLGAEHPHVQRLLGLGWGPTGHAVAVLAEPPGHPLQPGTQGLAPPVALSVLGPLARALDSLHAAGICHCELRPEHIFYVVEDGGVVLSGLGQVALESPGSGEESSGSRIIESEGLGPSLLHICAYLAPEQLLPERAGFIHRRIDVYALAAVAFHLLCGTPPFGPDGEMATLGAHLAAWRPLCSAYRPDLGEAVDAVLQRALALDPDQRPPSCGELVDDLRAALSSLPHPPSEAPTQPCVVVVAGTAPARRELQGLIGAVSPRTPVLADTGAHAMTLALRYRPRLVLLHQPSLADPAVLSLCRALCADGALRQTQVVVLYQPPGGPLLESLHELGVTLASSHPSSSSSVPSAQSTAGGRPGEGRPLLQLLRRVLLPSAPRPRRGGRPGEP